jgi:hypothetical protein
LLQEAIDDGIDHPPRWGDFDLAEVEILKPDAVTQPSHRLERDGDPAPTRLGDAQPRLGTASARGATWRSEVRALPDH